MENSKTNVHELTPGKAFKERYPRFVVSCAARDEIASERDEYIDEEGEPFSIPGARQRRLQGYPGENLVPVTESRDLKEKVPNLNQAILARALGTLYEEPADITCSTEWDGDAEFPLSWGYAVALSPDLIATIEGKLRRTNIRFFQKGNSRLETAASDSLKIAMFLQDLATLHESSAKYFQGAPASCKYSFINLYEEKFSGAQLLLRMAADPGISNQLSRWQIDAILDGQASLQSAGFLEVSAGVQFFMALEALINVTYAIFVKEPIRDAVGKLLKREIDIRMRCIHLLCDEFGDRNPFSVDLMLRVTAFKEWRNKVVHSDVVEDDLRVFFWREKESGLPVYFAPAFDHLGTKKEKSRAKFSRFQAKLTSVHVEEMQHIVAECKAEIDRALSDAGRKLFAGTIGNTTVVLQPPAVAVAELE